jgi:predicted thioesterase
MTEVATAVSVVTQMQELFLALGRAVTVLKRVQKVVGDDITTLSINALELRDKIADVKKRRDLLFADQQKSRNRKRRC